MIVDEKIKTKSNKRLNLLMRIASFSVFRRMLWSNESHAAVEDLKQVVDHCQMSLDN